MLSELLLLLANAPSVQDPRALFTEPGLVHIPSLSSFVASALWFWQCLLPFIPLLFLLSYSIDYNMKYSTLITTAFACLSYANILAGRARCADKCAVAIASDANTAVHISQVQDCQEFLGTTYYPTSR